jgi:radical SAM superfamily enzyme YgiQ (UPF0313 family)
MTGRALRIALGDLSYLNAENAQNLYMPLNIGYLASYAKRRFGRDVEITLFKDPRRFLEHCRAAPPDLIALSYYYWQLALNDLVVRKLGGIAPVVGGGPCIDSDPEERVAFMRRHAIDYAIPNEGEEGFADVVEGLLSVRALADIPVRGGNSTDLGELPSPYLDGTLDGFLDGTYQPMIQTSRLCPYTCAFCVSGKTRGKLRAFPLEQVRAELEFVARRFSGDRLLYLVDENFGILERDQDVARDIVRARERYGYPNRIFYYNDKRFRQNSRTIHEIVGDMCWHGVMLSLQSENPETLKVIKRRNLTDDEVRSAIGWAKGLGLKTSTELIFGLPMETRESFLHMLDKCARLGFEVIQCYALILFDGIEMNRAAYRAEHCIRTVRRPMAGLVDEIEGERAAETEEVVVGSRSFSTQDYVLIRQLNVLFHAIYVYGVQRRLVEDVVASGQSLTAFLQAFLEPSGRPAHDTFLADLKTEIAHELAADGLGAVVKIQPVFAGRLHDARDGWVKDVLQEVRAKRFMSNWRDSTVPDAFAPARREVLRAATE